MYIQYVFANLIKWYTQQFSYIKSPFLSLLIRMANNSLINS